VARIFVVVPMVQIAPLSRRSIRWQRVAGGQPCHVANAEIVAEVARQSVNGRFGIQKALWLPREVN
jgi:hypothetical protein